jgi:hypothetical protein
MKRTTFTNLLSIFVISSLVIACGSSAKKKPPTTGKVIDDYIAGAIVCADVNNNGIADDGVENCVETDNQGGFRFATHRTEALVMTRGKDIGTGKAFKGTFLAPPGSVIINPLTTLISSVMSEGNKTAEEAQTIVKTQLGLENTAVDLTTFDPLQELQFAEDTATKEVAQQVLAQQTTVQIILSVTATTISASSDTVQESHVSVEASNQIAQLMLAQENSANAPEISSEESIQTIIKETAQETFSESRQEHTEALASVVAVQQVVAQQVQETTQTVVTNIEAIQVDNTESGLTAIKESNSAILLVTDTTGEDSLTNIIEQAVSTGDTTVLEAVDISTEINNSANELIERPEVVERPDEEIQVQPTGAEGGTP